MTTANRYGPTALFTPANLITIARLAVTPFFIVLIVTKGASWPTAIVGALAAFSDGFDGIVARRYGPTRSGAFLDPLADKVIVLGSMYTLVAVSKMTLLPVVIITLREVWMSWFRSRASKRGISVPARSTAKLKTMVQDFAIAFCVLPPTANMVGLQRITLWLAVVLTVFTGYEYWRDGRRLEAARP